MRQHICKNCGKIYLTDKQDSTDNCANCGKPFVVNSSRQRYCPDCAKVVVPQNIKVSKRESRKEHADEINAARAERRKDRRICAVCGKPFSAPTPTVTCSPECAAKLKRQRQARADVKRGRADPARILGKAEHNNPQSGIPGITWCRNKWQLTYRGKYIGVFETVEEARSKKLQLEQEEKNVN